jgi:2-(1,2-epoxy-1,2-dihydrophenyl)acetyl-CoA isomerase
MQSWVGLRITEVKVMDLVRYEQEGAVGRLILARPEAGNAVTPAMIDDLAAAVTAAEISSSRALVITGEGANFCLGADLKHLAAAGDTLAAELEAMAVGFHAAQARLCALSIPVIAAVRGGAIGGGFGLAMSADFLVCTEDARFSTGYARLGLSADAGVSLFLTLAVGVRRARGLLIDSRFISAEEALELGIVYRTAPADQLDVAATALANQLADGPTAAIAAIKRLTGAAVSMEGLSQHLDLETEEIVALAGRPDVVAAISATLARTKPVFDH